MHNMGTSRRHCQLLGHCSNTHMQAVRSQQPFNALQQMLLLSGPRRCPSPIAQATQKLFPDLHAMRYARAAFSRALWTWLAFMLLCSHTDMPKVPTARSVGLRQKKIFLLIRV